MPSVYILSNDGHDYSPALPFGELVFCTSGPVDRNDTTAMFRELAHAMRGVQHTDYIIVGSLSTLCSIACGIMADRFGKINLLLFDRGVYLPKTVVFDSWYDGEKM